MLWLVMAIVITSNASGYERRDIIWCRDLCSARYKRGSIDSRRSSQTPKVMKYTSEDGGGIIEVAFRERSQTTIH